MKQEEYIKLQEKLNKIPVKGGTYDSKWRNKDWRDKLITIIYKILFK